MKFRVTFVDGVDLLVDAGKEVEAVRIAKELRDSVNRCRVGSVAVAVADADSWNIVKGGRYVSRLGDEIVINDFTLTLNSFGDLDLRVKYSYKLVGGKVGSSECSHRDLCLMLAESGF